MTAEDFVKNVKLERDFLYRCYTTAPADESKSPAVRQAINALSVSDAQRDAIEAIVGDVLTDAFYTFLMGLAGSASLGGIQQPYQLIDENGESVGDPIEFEEAAWQAFHGA